MASMACLPFSQGSRNSNPRLAQSIFRLNPRRTISSSSTIRNLYIAMPQAKIRGVPRRQESVEYRGAKNPRNTAAQRIGRALILDQLICAWIPKKAAVRPRGTGGRQRRIDQYRTFFAAW